MTINGYFVLREVAGEIYLVPVLETSMRINGLVTLNASGAAIWKSVEEGRTREQAIEILISEFNVDEETAAADYDEYVAALIKAGFITK